MKTTLDLFIEHSEALMNNKMTSEEFKALKTEKVASGEVRELPRSKNTSFDFHREEKQEQNLSRFEYEYHQNRLINSDA